MNKPIKIRLFVDAPLGQGQVIALEKEQAHYLFSVMRQREGGRLLLFNGRDGEWQVVIETATKRAGTLRCEMQTRAQEFAPEIGLLFAPVKKARTDFIVEKATEMGVARITPIMTDFTNSDRIRVDRMQVIAKEAAEQSRRLTVPQIDDVKKLDQVMRGWPENHKLLFANEKMAESGCNAEGIKAPVSVLVGPEGGFSDREVAYLRAHEAVLPISLGPRILRAETAVVAALAIAQIHAGDWS